MRVDATFMFSRSKESLTLLMASPETFFARLFSTDTTSFSTLVIPPRVAGAFLFCFLLLEGFLLPFCGRFLLLED